MGDLFISSAVGNPPISHAMHKLFISYVVVNLFIFSAMGNPLISHAVHKLFISYAMGNPIILYVVDFFCRGLHSYILL